MSMEWLQLERASSAIYGSCAGIWVMMVVATPTQADMLLARPSLAAMKRAHPQGFPTLTWVLPEAGYRMDHDARVAASEVTREFDAAIRAQATLIEGTGFQAAAVRAVISSMDFMSRSTGTKRVFPELAPAVSWCLDRVPPPTARGDDAEVTRAILAARPR